jgi:uncharacterized protein (DUF433 family)
LVRRAVDEGILKGSFSAGAGRRVSTADCLAIRFYFGTAKRLTAEERLFAIESIAPRLKQSGAGKFSDFVGGDWTIRDDFLTIDMAPFVKATAARLVLLGAARDLVTSSPEILSGTPTIGGTRIPVHDVAASIAAGHSTEAIRAAYPTLTAEQIELATIYAEAYPARGRPRAISLPNGATLISERTVPRRRKAA